MPCFSTATLLQDYIDQHFAEGVEETYIINKNGEATEGDT